MHVYNELEPRSKDIVSRLNIGIVIITFIIVLLEIFLTDTIVFRTNADPMFRTLKYFILVTMVSFLTLLFYNALSRNRVHLNEKPIKPIILLTFVVMINLTMIVNSDYTADYLIKFCLLWAGFLVSELISFAIFSYYFVRIMNFLILVSIVCYFLRPVLLQMAPFLPVTTNTDGMDFINLLICQIPVPDIIGIRNFGIFSEPGLFQGYIILTLLLNYYVVRGKHLAFYTTMSVLALLTTFSTSGYIALILIILCFSSTSLKRVNKSSQAKYYSVALLILVTLFISVNYDDFFNERNSVFGKLFFEDNASDSYYSRTDSLVYSLELAMENPMFGAGITTAIENASDLAFLAEGRALNHSSNTITAWMATFGLLIGIIHLCLWYKFTRLINTKPLTRFLGFVALIIFLSSQNLMSSILFNTLIFYAISSTTNHVQDGKQRLVTS